MTDDDTDRLMNSLLQMGYHQKSDKAADKKPLKEGADLPLLKRKVPKDDLEDRDPLKKPVRATAMPIARDGKGKPTAKKQLSRDALKDKPNSLRPRKASQVIPPSERMTERRSRLIRELEAGREAAFDGQSDRGLGDANDLEKADLLSRIVRDRKAEPEASKPVAAEKPAAKAAPQESLRDLAATKTPAEEYRRRRKLLAHDLQIGPDGLDTKFARYDRRKQAVFFAEMLAARQFDTFSSDRIWRAARMESRVTFLNAILHIHSKVHGFTASKLDDRFYEDISNMPSSSANFTGITSFDRERGIILLYPPFWNNAVKFQDMVRECIEQNTRYHVRQMAQLISNRIMKPDDPRFGQASLFNIQIDTFDDMVNALSMEARIAGERIETKQFVPAEEMGFDVYAKQSAQSVYHQLVDLIDEPDSGDTGR